MQHYDVSGDLRKLRLIKPVFAANAVRIKASYDTWKEWKRDLVGYWLFRVDAKNKEIQAGFCKRDNVIEILITGKDSEAIHNTIIREKLVRSMQHAAYIGHELHKAEAALKLGIKYTQDKPLDL